MMAYKLNKKLQNLKPYDPLEGNYKIRLDANESYLSFPQNIRDELAEIAASFDYNRYPDHKVGEPCKAFGEFLGIAPEYITAGNGSDELIFVIMNSFLEKGDTALMLEPDFSMYHFYANLCEINCKVIPKNNSFTFDVDIIIEEARKSKSKLIIFSNPCNPTGQGITAIDALKLVKSVDALVVLDEAYMDFWDQSIALYATKFDNLIVLRTCSKALGMAGLRMGFAIANLTLTNAIKAAKSPYNVNGITQAFVTAVIKNREIVNNAIKEVIKSRDELFAMLKSIEVQFLTKIKVFDTYTNFVLIKIIDAKNIHQKLLDMAISVRLIGSEYFRITAGNGFENNGVCEALINILKEEAN
jgi:histidinol-phosphate aminotransferase